MAAGKATVATSGDSTGLTRRQAVEQVRRRIAPLDARLLLQYCLGINHVEYLTRPDAPMATADGEAFMALVMRRERGEPLAYLTGEKEFFSRSFKVTPDVLIPRPDTELLVLLALERLKSLTWPRVADLGTGSGAIAVSIACEWPEAKVTAVDVSPAALAVAAENAERLGGRVEFRQSDWFVGLGEEQFDLIVSNPPYVAAQDPHLLQNGLPFEPNGALTDGGDGLSCLRAIISGAPAHLVPGGWLLLEHGYDQAVSVRELLAAGGFQEVGSWRDLADIERVSGGRLKD